ncbi:hypothetical protein [Streptomyces sp. NPDC094472]|uniref:hypothetical protein n=1 Tax=unclassified Streptomyces TaxID=2593676 RepID=UPI0033211C76
MASSSDVTTAVSSAISSAHQDAIGARMERRTSAAGALVRGDADAQAQALV